MSMTTDEMVSGCVIEREKELESLAADMFCWLADYLTPEQREMWESRLEELDVEPTWRWTR